MVFFPDKFSDEEIALIGKELEDRWEDLDETVEGAHQRILEYQKDGHTYRILGGKRENYNDWGDPNLRTWYIEGE